MPLASSMKFRVHLNVCRHMQGEFVNFSLNFHSALTQECEMQLLNCDVPILHHYGNTILENF